MKIIATTNGPLIVEGHLSVVDQNGKSHIPHNQEKFALCRCGQSAKKPFCDGTHAKIGFISPAQIPAA